MKTPFTIWQAMPGKKGQPLLRSGYFAQGEYQPCDLAIFTDDCEGVAISRRVPNRSYHATVLLIDME